MVKMNPVRPYKNGGTEKIHLTLGIGKRYIEMWLKGGLIG